MLIRELTRQESLDLVARTHLGRLGCSQGMQPYIVPIHFAYQNNCLYGFSMPGQKIDWMRANPLVCVEADHMSGEQWTTVVVFGRYEELSDAAEMRSELALALGLLQQRASWWEPGSVKIAHGDTLATLVPIFYRIKIVTRLPGAVPPLNRGRLTQGGPRPTRLKEVGYITCCGESGEGKQSFS